MVDLRNNSYNIPLKIEFVMVAVPKDGQDECDRPVFQRPNESLDCENLIAIEENSESYIDR